MKIFHFLQSRSPCPSPSKNSNTTDCKIIFGLPFFKSSKQVKGSSSNRSSRIKKPSLSFGSNKVLEQTFMVLDAHGDGHISVGELKAWMRSFFTILKKGKVPSEEEIAFMVAEIDKDVNGFLSSADFLLFLSSSSSSSSRLAEEEAAWFNAVDLNNDGLISYEELHKLMVQNLGIKSCTLQECRLIIEAHDSDGDGLLNPEDFRKLFLGFMLE